MKWAVLGLVVALSPLVWAAQALEEAAAPETQCTCKIVELEGVAPGMELEPVDVSAAERLSPERKKAIEDRVAQQLESRLEKYDQDFDGKLDVRESAELIKDMIIEFHERRQAFWKQFDVNQDGKLDEQEQQSALTALRETYEQRQAALVAEYDTDGDGRLSAEERAAIPMSGMVCQCSLGDADSASAAAPDTVEEAIPTSSDLQTY